MIAEQLKKSILQAAIQGKLTEQISEDGDARDLLKEITETKARLIKEGKFKKEKPLPEILEDEIPFEIPGNWLWCRLSDCLDVRDGTHDSPKYYPVGIPLVTSKNISGGKLDFENTKLISQVDADRINARSKVDIGDILFAMIGSIGNPVIVESKREFCIKNVALFKSINDSVHMPYILIFLKYVQDILKVQSSGGVQSFVSLKHFRSFLVPLPPLIEQKRIVLIVEEIITEINKLKNDEIKLVGLQKYFPKKIKDSILQYAIQGMLTEQLADDGNARDLLNEIQKEKAQLIKKGEIKKEKQLPEITEDEIPFDIPDSWCWVRIGNISYNHGQKKPDKTFTYIDIASINNSENKLGSLNTILNAEKAPSRARKIVRVGDVIYATVRPYLQNICVIDRYIQPEPIVSTGFIVVCTPELLLNKYLFWCFLSPMFGNYANDNNNSKGVAYPAINDEKFSKALIPLPPLSEQKRIIEKLEELLPLCETLGEL